MKQNILKCVIILAGLMMALPMLHALEPDPLEGRPSEEKEMLRTIAQSTTFHIEVMVSGIVFDGKKVIFVLRSRSADGRKRKHRISKLVFSEDERSLEYEKYFQSVYLSGRPCKLGLQMVTEETYLSQFSVIEGEDAGSLNTIPASKLTYISVGDESNP